MEELFQSSGTAENVGSGGGGVSATSPMTDIAEGTDSLGKSVRVVENSAGDVELVDQFGHIELVEDSGRVENIDGSLVLLEDNGGYVELETGVSTSGSRGNSVRGSRRRQHDDLDNDEILDDARRELRHARRRHRKQNSGGKNSGASQSKGSSSSGGKKSNQSSKSKSSKSKSSKSKSSKSKKMEDGPTPQPTPQPTSQSALRPTPMPTVDFTFMPLNNPTFIPVDGEPSAAPINNPGFPRQRGIDFSTGNCAESCVQVGEDICINAFSASNIVVIRLAYQVTDASGASEEFVTAVTVRGRDGCVQPESVCFPNGAVQTNTETSSPVTSAPATAEPTPVPTPIQLPARRRRRFPN